MKAVVFDMDGVIVDSELHWKSIESDFLQKLIPEWNAALQESILGMSVYDIYERLVREHDLKLDRSEFIAQYRELAGVIYGERSALLPGVERLIRHLHEHLPLAIASSSPKPWIEMVVERFSLGSFFTAWVSSDDVGGIGKPAPDIYLHAAERLGVRPDECLAIEDTEKGIRSAKTAGMSCVGVRNGFNDPQDLSQADAVSTLFDELSVERLREIAGVR